MLSLRTPLDRKPAVLQSPSCAMTAATRGCSTLRSLTHAENRNDRLRAFPPWCQSCKAMGAGPTATHGGNASKPLLPSTGSGSREAASRRSWCGLSEPPPSPPALLPARPSAMSLPSGGLVLAEVGAEDRSSCARSRMMRPLLHPAPALPGHRAGTGSSRPT